MLKIFAGLVLLVLGWAAVPGAVQALQDISKAVGWGIQAVSVGIAVAVVVAAVAVPLAALVVAPAVADAIRLNALGRQVRREYELEARRAQYLKPPILQNEDPIEGVYRVVQTDLVRRP